MASLVTGATVPVEAEEEKMEGEKRKKKKQPKKRRQKKATTYLANGVLPLGTDWFKLQSRS